MHPQSDAMADRFLQQARLSAVTLVVVAYGLTGWYLTRSLSLSVGAAPAAVMSFSLLPDASPGSGSSQSRLSSSEPEPPVVQTAKFPVPPQAKKAAPARKRESRSPGPTTSDMPTQRQAASQQSFGADNTAGAAAPASGAAASDTVVVSQLDYDGPPPRPVYPAHALRARQQGLVMIRVLIGKDGSVLRADVSQSSGFELLDQAAVSATLRTKFRPYTRSGVAVNASADLRFNFVVKP